MRATRAIRLIALALVCVAAIVAGDLAGRFECWVRHFKARRRLRRWHAIREARMEWEAAVRRARPLQCRCECHASRSTCGPCCEVTP